MIGCETLCSKQIGSNRYGCNLLVVDSEGLGYESLDRKNTWMRKIHGTNMIYGCDGLNGFNLL